VEPPQHQPGGMEFLTPAIEFDECT
jgi:hypothetical protein